MRIPAVLFAILLAATPLTIGGAPAARDDGWDFLRDRAAEQGLDLMDATVLQTITRSDGTITTVEIAIKDFLQQAAPPTAAAHKGPDVLAGEGIVHIRLDLSACTPYAVTPIAEDLTLVEASHPAGAHYAIGPDAHGLVLHSTNPAETTGDQDNVIEAVGNFTITENRVMFFGSCWFILGSLVGDGVAWFDREHTTDLI